MWWYDLTTGTIEFDYIPFPIFIHTTGMTHFLDCMAVTRLNWIRPNGEICVLVKATKNYCHNMCNYSTFLQLNFYTIIPLV